MRRILLLIATVLLSSCATQQAPKPRLSYGPALWVVESGSARVYLFGTMHLLILDVPWLTPVVRTALANSQDLWVETDVNDIPAVRKAVQPGFDPAYSLSAHLSPSEWKLLGEFVRECGGKNVDIEHMRPWTVNTAIYECSVQGMSKAADKFRNQGVTRIKQSNMPDLFLMKLATMSGIEVHGLESAQQHIAALADPPEAVQLAILHDTLRRAEKNEQMPVEAKRAEATAAITQLLDSERAWFTGDIEETGRKIEAAAKSAAPEVTASVYTIRNQNFADDVARLLSRQNHAFVAIGAGHFAGPGNVLLQLQSRGYVINRVE